MAMSGLPHSGTMPATALLSYPAPNHFEKRTDPTDGQEYTFDEVCARYQGAVDPVVFWYEKMGVVQQGMPPTSHIYTQPAMEPTMTQAVPTYAQYPHYDYGSTQPAKAYDYQPAPVKKMTFMSPRNVLFTIGFMIIFLLCIIPVWNAIELLLDPNYVFWAGRSVPTWIIISCLLMLALYLATSVLFCTSAHPSVQGTETSVVMVSTVFVTLFGLVLILLSLPLINQANVTYHALMHSCEYGEQTHRLYEYSQALQRVRSMPDCRTKYSVEECPGYEVAQPYTDFLKVLETNFRCSGFCYKPASNATDTKSTEKKESKKKESKKKESKSKKGKETKSKKAKGKKAMLLQESKHFKEHRVMPLSFLSEDTELSGSMYEGAVTSAGQRNTPVSAFPPTLFSDTIFQASCEGMAARDMKNFAGEIGQHTFYQGIYLVLIAVLVGFLKLGGFCVRKG